MTPKIIELEQAPVVLVEINESYAYPDTIGIGAGQTSTSVMELDTGNCIHIGTDLIDFGFLSDLTEEQFAECVDRTKTHPKYLNYNSNYFREFRASDSFASLLESENVYTENPFGEYPCESGYNVKLKNSCIDSCQGSCWNNVDFDYDEWKEAQSRTINPKRTIVLIRKENVK